MDRITNPATNDSLAADKKLNEKFTLLIGANVAIAFFGITLFALQAQTVKKILSIDGVALLLAGAGTMIGVLLGFLFGIPRILQHDKPIQQESQEEDSAIRKKQHEISHQPNTNLEQISDWLTKILVGVGLTQITKLPAALKKFAEYTSPGLGSFPNSGVFAIAILIYCLIGGFLIGYLWTRLSLSRAMHKADLSLSEKMARVENRLSQFEEQMEKDAKAYSIVQTQINYDSNMVAPTDDMIIDAVGKASKSMKQQIFFIAQDHRSKNWRELVNKPTMERTIPIFRALIRSDKENYYHRNHAQLGYALKDQRQPEWKEAKVEFDIAIKIRGPWEQNGWLFYEFNRAICKINLDEDLASDKASTTETREEILSDLVAAAHAAQLHRLIKNDPTIVKWFKVNKIDWSDFTKMIK